MWNYTLKITKSSGSSVHHLAACQSCRQVADNLSASKRLDPESSILVSCFVWTCLYLYSGLLFRREHSTSVSQPTCYICQHRRVKAFANALHAAKDSLSIIDTSSTIWGGLRIVFKRSVASPTATALSKTKKAGRRFLEFEHVGGFALEIRSNLMRTVTDDVDVPNPTHNLNHWMRYSKQSSREKS